MEFDYTIYGGFDAVVKALTAVSLIFSDNAYTTLFWAFAILGLVYVFSSFYLGALTGGRPPGIIEWAHSYWWAIFFYFFLIFPTGTLNVYDAHMNRYQSIGGLPMGVVFVGGVLNKVEEGLKEIVDTAVSPVIPYEDAGDGKGFDMFTKLYGYVRDQVKFPDEYDRVTLNRYMQECVVFEILSGNSSINDVRTDNDFLTNTFSAAANPAIYTIVYTEADRTGTTMTCSDAYLNYIRPTFTAFYFENMIESGFCPAMGYSKDSAEELVACKETLSAHMAYFAGWSGSNPAMVIPQIYISQYINDVVLNGNPAEAAEFVGARQVGTGMTGVAIMANEFIPIFRNVMIAIAFALTPVLFLFMSTFALEAFKYFIGIFIWLMTWGVVDVILHAFAMDYAYDLFTRVRDYQVSYSSVFLFDVYGARVLSVMGYMRVLGIMLSSSIVFGIMRFGGEAFARAAGSVQGKVESTGNTAGGTAFTPEGRSAYVDKLDRGIALGNVQKLTAPEVRQPAMAYDRMHGISRAGEIADHYGGWEQAGATTGRAAGINTAEQTEKTTDLVGLMGGSRQYIARSAEAGATEGAARIETTERKVRGIPAGREQYVEEASTVDATRQLAEITRGMGQIRYWGKGDYTEAAGKMAEVGLVKNIEDGEQVLHAVGEVSGSLGIAPEVAAALVGTHKAEERASAMLGFYNSEPVTGYMAGQYGVKPLTLSTFTGFLKGNGSKEDFLAHFRDDEEMMRLYDTFARDGDRELPREEMLKRFGDQKIAAGLELIGRKGALGSAEDIARVQAIGDDMTAFNKRYTETRKALGDIRGFKETADRFAWTPERLARSIAGKNYGSIATFIDQYGGEKGIGVDEAVSEISTALGAQEAGKVIQAYNKADAWGLGRDAEGVRKLAEFEEKGLLTKEMAGVVNERYGTGFFREGMQIHKHSWGVGPEGELLIDRAFMIYGPSEYAQGNILSWEKGKVMEEGSMGRDQVLAEAGRREEAGDVITAQGLRMTAGHMKGDDAVSYTKTFAQDGISLARAEYKHGTGTVLYDTASRREGLDDRRFDERQHYIESDREADTINGLLEASGYGTTVKKGDMVTMRGRRGTLGADAEFLKNARAGDLAFTNVQRGVRRDDVDMAKEETGVERISKDVDKGIVDHGIDIGSAMQMALSRDPAIARFVSDPKLAKYKPDKFSANVAETAKDLSEDVGKFLKKEGLRLGYSDGGVRGSIAGSAGLNILGTGGRISGGAEGRVGKQSKEVKSVDLLTAEYDRLIRQAVKESKEKGLGREETERYVTGKIGDFTQNIYDKARDATSLDYGVSAPVGVTKRILDEVDKKIGPININESKEDPD